MHAWNACMDENPSGVRISPSPQINMKIKNIVYILLLGFLFPASSIKVATVSHINGDLHRIDFLEEVNTNTSIAINIKAPFWHASRSDVMPNYYLVSGELEPVVIDSTRLQHRTDSQLPVAGHALSWTKPEQYRRNKDDALPFETARYDYDQAEHLDNYKI